MTKLTFRKLQEKVRCPQRERCPSNGEGMETEMRETPERSISAPGDVKLGSLLAEIGRAGKLSDEEFAGFGQIRAKTPIRH